MGRQVHLEVGRQDFYIDLLFYHLKLRCYVVIELKACDFEPGFVSQLNMYQNPIGVADWQEKLTKVLPEDLQSSLPSIEDIEIEIQKKTMCTFCTLLF